MAHAGVANPRQSNGNARRKAARRFACIDAPCALCGGRRGPIHYDEPRDHLHPLSLVIDERCPVARWQEFGYESARACATDQANWQAAHYVCNAEAGDKRKARKARRIAAMDAVSGTF